MKALMLRQSVKIFLTVALAAAVLPLFSSAQFNINLDSSLPDELNVEINPTYPAPNRDVSINLTLYTGNLNSAEITWYQDGRQVLSGRGETRYSFRTGAAGEESKFEIRVSLLGGPSFTKAFSINPASVDLIWEADSYVPPFYRGKALHSMQGNLKIVAVPEFVRNGRTIPPSELVYNWSNRVNAYPNQSGYGKNTLVIRGSLVGRSENIEVTVTDPISGLTAYSSINISPSSPEIVFYENNPYYGHMFNRAVTSFDLTGDEIQVVASPFFFTKEEGGVMGYEWRLNNRVVPSLAGSRTAIFRKPEGETGSSNISLRVENSNRILQQAEGSLIMSFAN